MKLISKKTQKKNIVQILMF